MGKRWKRALGVLVVIGMAACLAGCSQTDAVKAASMIHAYLPAVVVLANDAAATAEGVDPAEAGAIQALSAKVQAELQELELVSGAYAAAPSSDGWMKLGVVVDALVSDADQGLLAVLAIKNPASQVKAKLALSALDAAVHVVDGYLMTARTPVEAKAVAESRSASQAVKLESVARYWSTTDWQRVELAFGGRGRDLADAGMRLGF
jgi:hypothetical protein